jgi:hypothetical protein
MTRMVLKGHNTKVPNTKCECTFPYEKPWKRPSIGGPENGVPNIICPLKHNELL